MLIKGLLLLISAGLELMRRIFSLSVFFGNVFTWHGLAREVLYWFIGSCLPLLRTFFGASSYLVRLNHAPSEVDPEQDPLLVLGRSLSDPLGL